MVRALYGPIFQTLNLKKMLSLIFKPKNNNLIIDYPGFKTPINQDLKTLVKSETCYNLPDSVFRAEIPNLQETIIEVLPSNEKEILKTLNISENATEVIFTIPNKNLNQFNNYLYVEYDFIRELTKPVKDMVEEVFFYWAVDDSKLIQDIEKGIFNKYITTYKTN